MKHLLSTIFLFSFILFAACVRTMVTGPMQEGQTSAPTHDLNTATPTEVIHVGFTVIPTATWTSTPVRPTKTPAPTWTSVPKNTPHPDIQFTQMAYEQTATQIASFHATCDQFNLNDILLSPHGAWMAIGCGSSHDQTLEVVSKEGKKWILSFKDYLAPSVIRNGETGMGGLYPIHWTSNDEYLFFMSHLHYSGGGPCFYGFGVHGLFRINVKTGAVSTILKASQSSHGPDGYAIAFSPGGDKLAYIADQPVILDMRTGNKVTLAPSGKYSGFPIWSPDGTKLAFSTCSPSDDYYSTKKSGIQIYSLETHVLKTIIEVQKNFLRIDKSKGNQKLYIVNTDIQTEKYNYISYDWTTGEIATPSATP